MKKLFYFLIALMISQNLLAQTTKFWTGETNSNWNTASNWSPSGVPTSSDAVFIGDIFYSGRLPTLVTLGGSLTTTVQNVTLGYSTTLAVLSSARLNIVGEGASGGIMFFGEYSILSNSGSIYIEALNGSTLTDSPIRFNDRNNQLLNKGFIRINSTFLAIDLLSDNSIINGRCGRIIMLGGGSFMNFGDVSNSGLIETADGISQSSTFTNNGILKYGSLNGTITNTQNASIIVNNSPTPIFTYGGTYDGTVNGIYTNSTATTSAGTFTAPNTFTPSGTLPTGSQTLYAKITPSGGACNYIVTFTYDNTIPPSITTSGTLNAFSACLGTASASQSFSVSGANLTANIIINVPTGFEIATTSGGTYSSNLTLTRSGSSVTNTTIFVRLRSTATGTPSGDVTCTSTGATTQNIAATGTVTTLPTATISYVGTPFCMTASPANVTQTGTTGGAFTSSSGLILNTSTGRITPSTSTAGSYTVTLSIPASGGCPIYTTTTAITITAEPSATIGYSANSYCNTASVQNVTRNGTSGGTYSAQPAGLIIDTNTGQITPSGSTANNYVVYYTVPASGGCSQYQTTFNISIGIPASATIAYAASGFCSTEGLKSVNRTGTAGGTFTSSPVGLTISPSNG